MQVLEYITRRFNGVVGSNFIKVKSNSIELIFPNNAYSDYSVIANLLAKLASSFKNIDKKYVDPEDKHNHASVKLDKGEDQIVIKITGALYIPSTKFLKLYNMILWYLIRYRTGTKPGDSEEGRKLVNEWKFEEKQLKHEINRLPRRQISSYEKRLCHICGEETNLLNIWKFTTGNSNIGTDIETAVCVKHASRLI